MPERDATLDAFITPDPAEPEETTGQADQTRDESADDGPEPLSDGEESETEPVTDLAETTFSWTPDGTACEACGENARRRWRTDAGFVCQGCVDWERARDR